MDMTGRDRRRLLQGTRVYLIVTEAACLGPWERAVESALSSGVIGAVQLREKEIDDAAFLARARTLLRLASKVGALLLVNDRVHLVEQIGADGVHLGEDDMPVFEARRALGPARLIGESTHDVAEVSAAALRGADYLGLGPCYATSTKRLERAPKGPALVETCALTTTLPLFPIGGITPENVGQLVAAGARRVAVGAGILGADDPARAARALAAALPG